MTAGNTCRFGCFLLTVVALLLLALSAATQSAAAITTEEFKARVQEAAKEFKDFKATGVVTQKNKEALESVGDNYTQLYEFEQAAISLKTPDKLRMEGKLGMVRFSYIINGSKKILRASRVGINKVSDYSGDPAKLQDALDVGLVTPSMWRHRSIEVLEDEEAEKAGEIKLLLKWAKGNMIYYAWVDAENLWLKRFEKHDSKGDLLLRVVYSDPKKVEGVIWVPLKTEVYGPDGEKVGTSVYKDIQANTGLQDSLFE